MTEQMNKKHPLIALHKINKYYQMGENTLHVLKDIDLTIQEGEFVSIMGPSGSGKSTLINVLGFLDNDFAGEYFFQGKTVTHRTDRQISELRNRRVGFVFQDFNLIENMTVAENVALPLIYSGLSSHEARPRVQEVLDHMGIGHKLNAKPYELSGGQRQRVAIARALVNSPDFIIADEPTGALDTKTSRKIMDVIAKMNQEMGVTTVVVTHDPSLQRYATRHLMIVDGRLRESDVHEAEQVAEQVRQERLKREEDAQ
ncbi:ABC transporter ATP-binding protein [Allofustis seminis]|uniref:ABC transporter ATP-binding protein n=1 Tax=Allofustis seminis TaxID=166939 RepID=UPI00036B70F8|nr:ABC transporter ATP-binding protein [Allofustis seminis]